MAIVRLSDIEDMVGAQAMPKVERLALEFLEMFEPDRPLDQEELEEWIQVNALTPEEVLDAAKQAVHNGWVEDAANGLLLTADGVKRRGV